MNHHGQCDSQFWKVSVHLGKEDIVELIAMGTCDRDPLHQGKVGSRALAEIRGQPTSSKWPISMC